MPCFFSSCDRQVFGIAAELDVDAAARHVGRDHHRAFAARLGDQLALSFGVLGFGVQDACWIPSRFSAAEIISDTSTETVPTSTGWPFW